ncbi:MAG TPA: gamma-glutamylcyclotransferase family protein [Mucilaginibacter sp.]|nr:gamma-glutamylcyclotransferase family protein [Mucilaginibacter sp.]
MILFAFAGNMDVDSFAKTVPSAKKIGVARLAGYGFVFNKTAEDQSSKANIMPSANTVDEVWGVLIQLDDNERANFFNQEMWSSDFKMEPVNCITEDGTVYPAEAFTALPHATNTHLLPFDWYHQKVLKLAKNAGLPETYISKLELMPFKVDPDEERRQKRLKKL